MVIKTSILFLFFVYSSTFAVKLKNGDRVEFFISAKDLPSTGLNRYKFQLNEGMATQNGQVIWFDTWINSTIIDGPSPIWHENILNITKKRVDCVAYGLHRLYISEEIDAGEFKLIHTRFVPTLTDWKPTR